METVAWAGKILNGSYCLLHPPPFSPSMFQNEDVLLSKIRKTWMIWNILNLNLNSAEMSPVFLESHKLRDSLGAFTPSLKPVDFHNWEWYISKREKVTGNLCQVKIGLTITIWWVLFWRAPLLLLKFWSWRKVSSSESLRWCPGICQTTLPALSSHHEEPGAWACKIWQTVPWEVRTS